MTIARAEKPIADGPASLNANNMSDIAPGRDQKGAFPDFFPQYGVVRPIIDQKSLVAGQRSLPSSLPMLASGLLLAAWMFRRGRKLSS